MISLISFYEPGDEMLWNNLMALLLVSWSSGKIEAGITEWFDKNIANIFKPSSKKATKLLPLVPTTDQIVGEENQVNEETNIWENTNINEETNIWENTNINEETNFWENTDINEETNIGENTNINVETNINDEETKINEESNINEEQTVTFKPLGNH